MAEKATPRKTVPRYDFEFYKFTYQRKKRNPTAGSSAGGGDGDGDGDGAAAQAPAPRPEPTFSPPRSPSPPEAFTYNPGAVSNGGGSDGVGAAAPPPAPPPEPSSLPPRSPSPPEAFTYDPSAGSTGGGGGGGGAEQPEPSPSPPLSPWPSDDEDYVDPEDEPGRRRGDGSLFLSAQNLPRYIGRQDNKPLITQEYFSLRCNWQQLLDGKKTYLYPPNNNRASKDNYENFLFVKPKPLQKAVGCQEPLSMLIHFNAEHPIIQRKFKILSEHYACFRPVRWDGSHFYRAFIFSYLENLGKMQGSQAEVTRLMECLARSRENFCRLQWNNAYFSNPEAFFSSVVSEFEHLVNSVANGLNADELYKRSLQEITSSRILSLLRLLTEVHIRTHEAYYNTALGQEINALLFCITFVRPFDAGVNILQMRALSHALGIPLCLKLVDETENNGTAQVTCFDFLPQLESGVSRTSDPLSSIRSYYLSSTTDKHPEQGRDMPSGNLSNRMPLVTLLVMNGDYAILYRK